jgi:regulator of protease activity HflC (stomatin/prohibitin superfamily)
MGLLGALVEKIWDFLALWISRILPWEVMGDDEIGLVRRLGKYKRDLKPGLNFKWPIIEECMSCSGALDSTVLREQTLTTKDGKSVTLRGVVGYQVVDARAWILGCETAEGVLNDVGCGVLADVVPALETQEVINGTEFCRKLRGKMATRGKQWGIKVTSFGLVDRVEAPAFRLLGGDRLHGVSQ